MFCVFVKKSVCVIKENLNWARTYSTVCDTYVRSYDHTHTQRSGGRGVGACAGALAFFSVTRDIEAGWR